MGYGRLGGQYHDDSEFSEFDGYYNRDQDYPLQRQDSRQNMFIEKEEELLARTLERTSRARALGKTNVKLSQAEIDVLERYERAKAQPKVSQAPKASPAGKKMSSRRTIEAGRKKRSDSPKSRPVEGRVRNKSNVSTRSAREDDLVSYHLHQDSDYGYVGRPPQAPDHRSAYHGSPLRPGGSRSNSSSNIRQMAGPPPMYAPYYQNQRIVSMPEGPYYRRGESVTRRLRADSDRSDQGQRSRSNSHLRSFPLDQLPNPTQTARAPRFDPTDPRFGPARRVVSGPPYGQQPMSRRQSDEMFLNVNEDAEVTNYMVSGSSPSTSDSDGSYLEPGVTVDVTEKPGTKSGYAVRTRSAAAASASKSTSKSNAKASLRRR